LVDDYQRLAPTSVARLDRRSPERIAERALVGAGRDALGQRLVDTATRRRSHSPRRPSCTVVNGATAATADLLRALDPGDRTLVIAHELSTGWFHNVAPEGRALLRAADGYLAVSRCVATFLVERLDIAADRVCIAPPMVEIERTASPAPTAAGAGRAATRTVGGGGMTDWRKAPELWLHVAAEVHRSAPELDVRFVWFGGTRLDEPASWPLAHEIDHLGMTERVSFLGELSDPTDVLRSCDVFVSTAREDAYPLVCAEAAANGVPVIAFDGGGAAELIVDGGCGEVSRYPDLLAAASATVGYLRDPERSARAGERGRAFARSHLDVSVVAPQVERWIEGAIT
jgi:glycosyltransferase involved in cell wall biosynthesis